MIKKKSENAASQTRNVKHTRNLVNSNLIFNS